MARRYFDFICTNSHKTEAFVDAEHLGVERAVVPPVRVQLLATRHHDVAADDVVARDPVALYADERTVHVEKYDGDHASSLTTKRPPRHRSGLSPVTPWGYG